MRTLLSCWSRCNVGEIVRRLSANLRRLRRRVGAGACESRLMAHHQAQAPGRCSRFFGKLGQIPGLSGVARCAMQGRQGEGRDACRRKTIVTINYNRAQSVCRLASRAKQGKALAANAVLNRPALRVAWGRGFDMCVSATHNLASLLLTQQRTDRKRVSIGARRGPMGGMCWQPVP